MDTLRRLNLLACSDLAAWPNLARDLERSADASSAAKALRLLHAQGHVVEAAQWLAHVTDSDTLQTLRAALLAHAEGWQVGPLRALTLDLLSGAYRLIPAGAFIMGSPPDDEDRFTHETPHTVTITQPLLLKATPVTQGEWRALMGDNPSSYKGSDQRPVDRVSWDDAARACEVLSAQTGGAHRLPTEAEWEYACRAGTTTPRYGDLDQIAWYIDNASFSPHPVSQKQPNGWGLYDMLGNAWEWCHDWFSDYPSAPQRDPCGPPHGTQRVRRGGAWSYIARLCRAAQRDELSPNLRDSYTSFRPAHTL